MKKSYKLFGVYLDGVEKEDIDFISLDSDRFIDYNDDYTFFDLIGYHRKINLTCFFKTESIEDIACKLNNDYFNDVYINLDISTDNKTIYKFVLTRLRQCATLVQKNTNKKVFITKEIE